MSTRTVPISSQELDDAIEVLASAGQALQPSRFQRFSYRALVISADAFLACWVLTFACRVVMLTFGGPEWLNAVDGVFVMLFVVAFFFLMIALALNIPLFGRASRERARLKERGLDGLSNFLWKESRRSRRIGLARKAGLVAIGLDQVVTAFMLISGRAQRMLGSGVDIVALVLITALFTAIAIAVLFGARYLQNQRERLDLTSSAGALRKTLQSLRQRADGGVVAVPAELLERTAKIETTQIAAQRKDAVLESVASRDSGYAISYGSAAAQQRATLPAADRLELEDLVAQLSTEGAPVEPQPGANQEAATRRTTGNRHVEVEYSVDEASRRLHIVAVAPTGGPDRSLTGARHA